jgi:hypothetical protein
MVTRTIIPIRDHLGSFAEPTLDEMLSDAIVRAVMRADGVDTAKLRVVLNRIGSEIGRRRSISGHAEPPPRRLLDCLPVRL